MLSTHPTNVRDTHSNYARLKQNHSTLPTAQNRSKDMNVGYLNGSGVADRVSLLKDSSQQLNRIELAEGVVRHFE